MLHRDGAWKNSVRSWSVLIIKDRNSSVFYRADTVQVSGIIDHVLDKHTVCLKASELEMTQRWKNALCKAFEIAGSEKDYVKMW